MMFHFEHMEADCLFTDVFQKPFDLLKLKKAFSKWQYALEGKGWNAGQRSRVQGSPGKISPLHLGPGWSLRQREPSLGAGRVSRAWPHPQALKAPGRVSPSNTRPPAPRATTQRPPEQEDGPGLPRRRLPHHRLSVISCRRRPHQGRPSPSLQRRNTIASWRE